MFFGWPFKKCQKKSKMATTADQTIKKYILKLLLSVTTLQLPEQSIPITTNFASLNPAEVYSIQHYVIKLVSDLQQVGGFLHQ